MDYDSHWQLSSTMESLIRLFTSPIDLTLATRFIHNNSSIYACLFCQQCILLFQIHARNTYRKALESSKYCIRLYSSIGKSKQYQLIIFHPRLIRISINTSIFVYVPVYLPPPPPTFTLEHPWDFWTVLTRTKRNSTIVNLPLNIDIF